MASASEWIAGARPRTLVAGAAPVVVGTFAVGTWTVPRFALCLTVALGLQVGVNYLNDAADASRGIDAARVGPRRLVASDAATSRAVLGAAAASVTVAAIAGLVLSAIVGSELIVVGALLLLLMFGYSAGPAPYAGLGLGELFVFICFGLVATVGTAYVQAERLVDAAWWAAVPVGFAAVLIMLANNIRDIDTDAAAGKRTLPVRLGRARSIIVFRTLLVAIFASIVVAILSDGLPIPAWLALLVAPLGSGPWQEIASRDPRDLIGVLEGCAILQGQLALALALAFYFG